MLQVREAPRGREKPGGHRNLNRPIVNNVLTSSWFICPEIPYFPAATNTSLSFVFNDDFPFFLTKNEITSCIDHKGAGMDD